MSKANSKRKYFTEFNLNIFSSDPTILAPADLDKISDADDEARERVKNSNIYLILKRPRISFLPETVGITNKEVVGSLIVQMEESVFETTFDLIPEIRAMNRMRFPLESGKRRSRHEEETIYRRADYWRTKSARSWREST